MSDLELTVPKSTGDKTEFIFEPGRKHPHQVGEGTLRVRTTHDDRVFECEIPMKEVTVDAGK